MHLRFGEHLLGKRTNGEPRLADPRPVPFVEDIVHQSSAQSRIAIGIGGERFELAQPENFGGVELVGIAQKPVESCHLDIDLAQIRVGARCGAFVLRRRMGGPVHALRHRRNARLAIIIRLLAKQRLDPQKEPRRQRRSVRISLSPAEHHFGRTHRTCKIMRGKPDAELGSGNAQRAKNPGREQCFGSRSLRPCAFVQTRANHQIGPSHPAFEQPVNRDARMAAIGRAYRNFVHRFAQNGGQIGRHKHRAESARLLAYILDHRGQRTPVLARPDEIVRKRLRGLHQ